MRNLFVVAVVLMFITLSLSQAGTVVYFNNFDSPATLAGGVSATAISGQTSVVSVQNLSGLGPAGNQFGGVFAYSSETGNPATAITLTLSGLPTHTSVDLSFLFAAIDSWDGITNHYGDTTFSPDIFNVTVNGNSVFSQTLANVGSFANPLVPDQTYAPAVGVELGTPFRTDRFDVTNSVWNGSLTDDRNFDSAYDFGLDSHFQSITDASGSLTIKWFASGTGWQGGTDESWGLDNVSVTLEDAAVVPTPAALPAGLVGLAGLALLQFKARRKAA